MPGTVKTGPAGGPASRRGVTAPHLTALTRGGSPLFGKPHTARRWLGCAHPSRPRLGSRSSNPVRAGHGEPVTGASRPCAAMRERSTACRSAIGLSAASKRRSIARAVLMAPAAWDRKAQDVARCGLRRPAGAHVGSSGGALALHVVFVVHYGSTSCDATRRGHDPAAGRRTPADSTAHGPLPRCWRR